MLCTKKRLSPCSSSGGGRVRVTVRSEAYRENLLSSKFIFENTVVPVTPADCVVKSVCVRDLPFEVSDESIVSVFSTYGKVYSVKSVYHSEFPAICTGTRFVLMSVNDPVPSVVNVHGFECLVSWSASLLFRLSFVRPSTPGMSSL